MAVLMRGLLYSSVRFGCLLLLSVFVLAGAPRAETDDKARQYKLEAAFLYNFLNYVTWPGNETPEQLATPTICVLQGDPISPYLNYVQQKMSSQRQLMIRRLVPDNNADGCNLLFVRRNMILQTKRTIPILTVSADSSPASMITMRAVEGRMALRINNTALSEQGFQVSSRLLSLAQEVK
jgi:hypothetical protein